MALFLQSLVVPFPHVICVVAGEECLRAEKVLAARYRYRSREANTKGLIEKALEYGALSYRTECIPWHIRVLLPPIYEPSRILI
jgi:hypothetical protein